MPFLWPKMLFLLVIVPLAALVYLHLSRQGRKQASRYADLMHIEDGFAQRAGRHVPPLLFLLSLTALVIAVARPVSTTFASRYKTVILAVDASISMRADDIAPSRIGAAREVARRFVGEQPRDTRIGVVSFALYADVEQAPTHDRQAILEAIERFPLQHGTAIGSAILASLKIIFPEAELDLASPVSRSPSPSGKLPAPANGDAHAWPAGSYPSAAVILLTDGDSTVGPSPIDAARMAAALGVRVYTVGFGVPDRGQATGSKDVFATDFLDEKTLMEIAGLTGAEYFYAGTATDLSKIYKTLGAGFGIEKTETEIGALFAAAAALFATIAAALSLLWFNRIL